MVQADTSKHPVDREFLFKIIILSAARNFSSQASWFRLLVEKNRDADSTEPGVRTLCSVMTNLAQVTDELALTLKGNADALSHEPADRSLDRAIHLLSDIQDLEVEAEAARKTASAEVMNCQGSC